MLEHKFENLIQELFAENKKLKDEVAILENILADLKEAYKVCKKRQEV